VPPYAVRGSGFLVVDADGHEVIDLQGNQTALVHGHAHPQIVAAVVEAAAAGASFGLPNTAEVELAERLRKRIPVVERIRFANSGTEAVMLALRIARAYTGRPTVLRFSGAYHGTYDDVVDEPARGIPPRVRDSVVALPFGDEAAFRTAIDEHGDRLACVLVDLMPNRVGLVSAEPGFAELLRSETAARGILLVADEVITFRLATGGLHTEYGLEPDLVVLGKLIGGGLPVGAYGGRAEVMAVTDPREPDAVQLGGTFTGNPLTMRAGARADQPARRPPARGTAGTRVPRHRPRLAPPHRRRRPARAVVAALSRRRPDRPRWPGLDLDADGRGHDRGSARAVRASGDVSRPHPEVAVIGAGALGLCTAFHLTELGVDTVTVIERGQIAAESSGLSVGIIETQYLEPVAIEIRARSMDFFRRLEHEHNLEITRNGYLRLGRTADDLAAFERSVEIQRELGVDDARVLDQDGLRVAVPDLECADLAGGLFGPSDGYVDGHSYCMLLADLLRDRGVRQLSSATSSSTQPARGPAESAACSTPRPRSCRSATRRS